MNVASFLLACVLVIAAVKVVLPWSTCPIVPMFTCGLLRSNFSLLIVVSLSHPSHSSYLSHKTYGTNGPYGTNLLTCHALNLRDHFFSDVLGRLIITLEMHRRSRATLRCRTQVGRIAKHFRQRHVRGDHLCPAWPYLSAGELSPALHQIAIHGAHIIVGRHHFDPHDRFQQNRLGLPDRVLESQRTGNNECALVRVNLVKTA